MRRVCLVTCLRWPEVSESDGYVKRALEARGVAVEAPSSSPGRPLDTGIPLDLIGTMV